jgi:hypothetical protein
MNAPVRLFHKLQIIIQFYTRTLLGDYTRTSVTILHAPLTMRLLITYPYLWMWDLRKYNDARVRLLHTPQDTPNTHLWDPWTRIHLRLLHIPVRLQCVPVRQQTCTHLWDSHTRAFETIIQLPVRLLCTHLKDYPTCACETTVLYTHLWALLILL